MAVWVVKKNRQSDSAIFRSGEQDICSLEALLSSRKLLSVAEKGEMLYGELRIKFVDRDTGRSSEQAYAHSPLANHPSGVPLMKYREAEDLGIPIGRFAQVPNRNGHVVNAACFDWRRLSPERGG